MNLQNQTVNDACSIRVRALAGREEELSALLRSAATLVRETEAQTLQWTAVREAQRDFRIVDFFANEEGRNAHFAGQVAAALKVQAPTLVQGDWEHGVVANIQNARVLSHVVRERTVTASACLASHITIKARESKEAELATLLTQGARIVEQNGLGTLLWYALQLDDYNFAIYDVFSSEQAREAHFSGQVAQALKARAEALIEGGWQNGVLKNIVHSEVLSATF